jgi:hypothetical protein
MAPEAMRALLWRRPFAAGYPVEQSGLGLWDLWLFAMVKEMEHETIESNSR